MQITLGYEDCKIFGKQAIRNNLNKCMAFILSELDKNQRSKEMCFEWIDQNPIAFGEVYKPKKLTQEVVMGSRLMLRRHTGHPWEVTSLLVHDASAHCDAPQLKDNTHELEPVQERATRHGLETTADTGRIKELGAADFTIWYLENKRGGEKKKLRFCLLYPETE